MIGTLCSLHRVYVLKEPCSYATQTSPASVQSEAQSVFVSCQCSSNEPWLPPSVRQEPSEETYTALAAAAGQTKRARPRKTRSRKRWRTIGSRVDE